MAVARPLQFREPNARPVNSEFASVIPAYNNRNNSNSNTTNSNNSNESNGSNNSKRMNFSNNSKNSNHILLKHVGASAVGMGAPKVGGSHPRGSGMGKWVWGLGASVFKGL